MIEFGTLCLAMALFGLNNMILFIIKQEFPDNNTVEFADGCPGNFQYSIFFRFFSNLIPGLTVLN